MRREIIRLQDYKGTVPLQTEVYLTSEDWKVLHANFPTATCIQYSYPYIVICGTVPPPEPITVKGLIVEFYNDISEFQYCPGEVGNPTVKDPLPKWVPPMNRRIDAFESIERIRLQASKYRITRYPRKAKVASKGSERIILSMGPSGQPKCGRQTGVTQGQIDFVRVKVCLDGTSRTSEYTVLSNRNDLYMFCERGDSGGPVIEENGNMVGIILMTAVFTSLSHL
jgi:hypothetical protein